MEETPKGRPRPLKRSRSRSPNPEKDANNNPSKKLFCNRYKAPKTDKAPETDTYSDPEAKPRLILKFKLHYPNPMSPDLLEDLRKGHMVKNFHSIHTEPLYGPGYLPQISGSLNLKNPSSRAISKGLLIDEQRIRKLIDRDNRLTVKKNDKNFIDDKMYFSLLRKQCPERFNVGFILDSGVEEQPAPEPPVKVEVRENGIIMVTLKRHKFLVQRTSVVIPRLSRAVEEAFLPSNSS